MYPMANSLSKPTPARLVEMLNARLADAIDLQTQMKQVHWNVKGPSFIALHKLFDKLHEDVENYVDLIAERTFGWATSPSERRDPSSSARSRGSIRSRSRPAVTTSKPWRAHWRRSERLSELDVAIAIRPPARITVRSEQSVEADRRFRATVTNTQRVDAAHTNNPLVSDDSRRRLTIMAVQHSTKATRIILLESHLMKCSGGKS
jgi:hypothetical protein